MLVLLETRITSSRGGAIMKNLGVDKWNLVEGNVFFGGLWMAWKSQRVNAETISNNFQSILAEIIPETRSH